MTQRRYKSSGTSHIYRRYIFGFSPFYLDLAFEKIGACGKTTKVRDTYLPLKRN